MLGAMTGGADGSILRGGDHRVTGVEHRLDTVRPHLGNLDAALAQAATWAYKVPVLAGRGVLPVAVPTTTGTRGESPRPLGSAADGGVPAILADTWRARGWSEGQVAYGLCIHEHEYGGSVEPIIDVDGRPTYPIMGLHEGGLLGAFLARYADPRSPEQTANFIADYQEENGWWWGAWPTARYC